MAKSQPPQHIPCSLPPGKIWEYRICMPMSVEEYHIAQLWSVAEASKNETGGGEGLEVKVNDPFTPTVYAPDSPLRAGKNDYPTGQYTHKIYHLQSKIPSFIRAIAPKGSMEIHERAWNAYPYCRTVIQNPDYMKENFYIIIESFHAPDRGTQENVHNLNADELEKREVVNIDIANNNLVTKGDYKEEWDPTKVQSEKAERGPLPEGTNDKDQGAWSKTCEPVMCCYKLVRVVFKWWGLQGRVEKFIMKQEKRIFLNFHRQVYCWMDKWYGLTMEDIRRIEASTKEELDQQRKSGNIRGTKVVEE